MRVVLFTVLGAVLVATGASGALHYNLGRIAIPEPASLALLGAGLLGLTKLLRNKLRS